MTSPDPASRILTREECQQLATAVTGMARGGGRFTLSLTSQWTGELRWGRNRVTLASDRRAFSASLSREIARISTGRASADQPDEEALRAMVRAAERTARESGSLTPASIVPREAPPPDATLLQPIAWSDATFGLDAAARGATVRMLLEPIRRAGMIAAGYLSVRGTASAAASGDVEQTPTTANVSYRRATAAQCSITVRDPAGVGSGWAGVSSYDWGRIDPAALAARALDKCLASRNPVAIEPGRYVAILEPQAVHDLLSAMAPWLGNRMGAESRFGPFAAPTPEGPHDTKLGQRIADERITIDYDPHDPNLAESLSGRGTRPVTWIERGVLRTLGYERGSYALPFLNRNTSSGGGQFAYRMTAGDTTQAQMIASTPRGVLVTRFSNVAVMSSSTLLMTGFTRDGLWLVENGAVTKAVKNFRFTESPLFMLNNIEAVGTPAVPVFSPDAPAVVPPLKVRDFSFTSLTDAI